ncbi:MAG TPA: FHA domain-containing protein [Candidatus Limnocylindrales bacterium]|nr:FHA domain-containing protein [Candidatus Limnocylindrales bacterium]
MDLNNLCMGCMEVSGADAGCTQCGWVEGTGPESPLHLPPRSVLSKKYLLGRVLGQGGFGITYLAWDIYLDRKLAVKEYFPRELVFREKGYETVTLFSNATQGQYEYGLDKFIEEGKILAKLEGHPNIVSVKDFFKNNNTAYLVMSYVEGISLSDYLERHEGTLSFEQASQIMMPVLDALRAIHDAGLLHRDVSPDNIYITVHGRVIILDFGAARQALGEKGKKLSVILKPGYAPEEQYRSKGIQGPWTDIYAVGATMYQAITDRMPPDSLDRLEYDPILRPTELGAAIRAEQELVLMKSLAVKAEARFQTVALFQAALNPVPIARVETWETAGDGVAVPKAYCAGQQPAILKAEPESAEVMTIGRSPENNLVLSDMTTSRYHARIFRQSDHWYIDDLNSSHGTFINGRPITAPVELLPSSVIKIGGNQFYFDGCKLLSGEGDIVRHLPAIFSPSTNKQAATMRDGLKVPLIVGLSVLCLATATYLFVVVQRNPAGEAVLSASQGIANEGVIESGTIEYDGGTYTGELKNGVPHGEGVMVYLSASKSLDFSQIIRPSGVQKYSGAWKDGKKHGVGTMTYSDGSIRVGIWEYGQFIGSERD